jgi:hypothetical protein
MKGHFEQYEVMHILAVRLPGFAAPLETRLIKSAMAEHGMRCKNTAMDSRGCVGSAVGYVYIVQS